MPKVYQDGRRGGGRATLPLERIFAERTRVEGDCLIWTGQVHVRSGYARLKYEAQDRLAHRVAYEHYIGPIPDGLVIDHLCRNRACVNPLHLEPVTNRENILRGLAPTARNARKTHCVHGHEFTPENTFLEDGRKRKCRQCWADRNATASLPDAVASQGRAENGDLT